MAARPAWAYGHGMERTPRNETGTNVRAEPSPPTTPDDVLREILTESRTIAVVGLSGNPDRDSHRVARYLQEHGYQIIPVNPAEPEVRGEKSYASLAEVPVPVDVVDVFRRPEAVPEIVDAAIRIRARVVWLQLGIRHDEAAAKAREAGLDAVQDRCMKVEHARLVRASRGR